MITIDNMKHFIAVVDNNGVNKAAEHIFISSSSLSRSINFIEETLKVDLFDRVGRTIILNNNGKEFYQKCLKLIESYEKLIKFSNDKGQSLVGHYMVGASHFLCKHFVAKTINNLSKKLNNATFGLYSYDSSILVKKIHLGEVDIGFSFGLKDSELTDSQILMVGQLRLCVGVKHPLVNKSFNEVKKKLSSYPATMHRPTESIERCDNHPVYKQYDISPQINTYWDSDFSAFEVLADNESWSLLPDIVIDSDPRITALKHPRTWSAPYNIKMYWNKRKSNQVLRDFLLSEQ